MTDCIFCKIVAGEVPAFKVYEDNKFLAFFDVTPLNPGHTLLIPKEHVRRVWDCKDMSGYGEVMGKVANALRKAFDTEYVVSMVFGEQIPHAHVHLVPRLPDDGHGGTINMSLHKQVSPQEMKEVQEKIVKAF